MRAHFLYVPNEATRQIFALRIKSIYHALEDPNEWYGEMLREVYQRLSEGKRLIAMPFPLLHPASTRP